MGRREKALAAEEEAILPRLAPIWGLRARLSLLEPGEAAEFAAAADALDRVRRRALMEARWRVLCATV